jgi:dipeptidyl-peptidase 4
MKLQRIPLLTVLFFALASAGLYAQSGKKEITLEDIFKARKFSARGVYGIYPMKNGDHYCQLKKDSLNVYEYQTGKYLRTIVTAQNLIPAGDTIPIEMGGYEFSSDEAKLLFATDEEPIYRRSSKAVYFIYDIREKSLKPLSVNGKQRLATFSPDAARVVFVRDNNIFYTDLKSGVEVQVTTDGKINEIINGATDWVYEEEFEFSKAFDWSPDGSKIAYYRFDESKVKEYQLTYYGECYPEQYSYKYPKAGEANSIVDLYIYDVVSTKALKIDPGAERDVYFPRMKWTTSAHTLAFYRMNRHQNKLELVVADGDHGATSVIYTEENKYYIEINDHLTFLKNNGGFVLTSEQDGFRHIYHYAMDGKLIKQLTKGNWEVIDIAGVDEAKGLVYYLSTETSPLDKDLYAITFDGATRIKLNRRTGSNSPDFSSSYAWFINRWSDINTPPITAVYNSSGEEVRVLQDNAKLRETMVEYNFGQAKFFQVKTAGQVTLNGWMLKPPDFDSLKKYPVLFTVYGGPGSQTVTNSWGAVSAWNQLWAQHGIIVVSVDNRGTGGRGAEFKKCTYLQLGKYETEDQIEAAKYLGGLRYVDKGRIGMWGWSFGGYLTLSAITRGADVFSFGIAVAPVTNWKYYDNIYTERFMRTPKENRAGYEDNSPVNHAGKFKGRLLMIHGMADDNVHPQNAYDMMTALVGENKQFESQFYPNSNHGIYTGKNTSFHLYNRMTSFILNQ